MGMLALPPVVIVLLRRVVPVQVDQRFIRRFFALSSLIVLIIRLQLCIYIPVYLPA